MNGNNTDKNKVKKKRNIYKILKESETEERKVYNLIYILINSIAMQK